jgi:hypothetical protein
MVSPLVEEESKLFNERVEFILDILNFLIKPVYRRFTGEDLCSRRAMSRVRKV